ncbi:MAG: SufS family cysteine desulfurase [bacterium]|nr:SufS family cysteine desulfurase [bacterium]
MNNLRQQFPILSQKINGQPLVYFDNAATAQKPQAVLDAINDFYTKYNSNVHRSFNPLGEKATQLYEEARQKVAQFINAKSAPEIIFTSGTTESINLVAQAWGQRNLKKGDRVVISIAEHHSNFVPWLQLKEEVGIEIDVIPLSNDYKLDIKKARTLLQQNNVKLLAITGCSNVLGEITNLQPLLDEARERGIVTLVDAAQLIAHEKIDVQKLGCDFLAFSGHKLFGPTGIGVLYARKELLEQMPAWQGGGEMIQEVHQDSFTVNELPHRFEAGTPNIAGAVGLGAAIDFVMENFDIIKKREQELTEYFLEKINQLDFIKLVGGQESKNRAPVFSFTIDGVHPHDAADILGERGIILRAGHHCAQPLHESLSLEATLRASLSFYNTTEEIDKFFKELTLVYKKFQ